VAAGSIPDFAAMPRTAPIPPAPAAAPPLRPRRIDGKILIKLR